jgi:hypothetical protein
MTVEPPLETYHRPLTNHRSRLCSAIGAERLHHHCETCAESYREEQLTTPMDDHFVNYELGRKWQCQGCDWTDGCADER